nr:unnamed protein product [Callosobruchus chinensis]
MNIDTLKWDPVLLQFFGIKPTILPQIKSSSEVYGIISEGSLSGVKLAGCLGDQQSALVGQQCLNKGQAKATYGTGCFLLYNTGNLKVHSSHGLLTTVAYQFGSEAQPVYALEGSVAVAGAAINWLRDNLGILPNSVKTGEVYFVPAFSGLYAPYWQQEARGVIVGIAEDTDTSHIVRATLEAVCYQTRDILEAMSSDYGGPLSSLQVDGGMTANPLLMQLQADLAGITVLRPEMAECTALGAAMAAGAAVGCWDVGKPLKLPCIKYSPKMTSDERDVKYSKWKMAIDCSTGWNI